MGVRLHSDIFEVLRIIEEQNRKMHDFCDTRPEPRKILYNALFINYPGKFFPMKMPSGKIRLTPYQPNLWLYRGQTCDHGKCFSSLYRNELSETDLLIARIKEIQFETVLLTHPAVIDLIKNDFHINFKGLAQHYSLKTELLDLTSDHLVAAFFATCSYSCCSNSYFPQTASKIGVIYKTLQLALSSSAPNKRICFDIVGLQPFHRPGEQKAYSYELHSGETFPAHKLLFKQSKEASNKIYEMFEEGKKLLPEDPIARIASEINSSRFLDESSIISAVERYGFKEAPKKYYDGLFRKGYSVVVENRHLFTETELNDFSIQWLSRGKDEFFSQIEQPPFFSL